MSLSKHAIRVLVVSENAASYRAVADTLALFSGIGVEWADSARAALADMSRGAHDAYLVASQVGETLGLDLFREALSAGCHVPFILIASNNQSADEALRAGVTDYLTPDRMDASALERSIRYSIQRVRRVEENRKIDEEITRRVRERTSQLESFNTALQSEIAIRKKAEAALHKQTRILHAILNSMGEGVVVADENGNFLVYNQVARSITGMGPVNEAQNRWSEIYGFYGPDGETVFPSEEVPLARAMRGESVDNVEMFVRNAGVPGGVIISVTARPLKDERGSIGGGLVVFRDITEQKRAHQALEASLAKLHSANTELESFSYSVSHDLRAPLRHIDGFVNLLRESAARDLDQRSLRYLSIISESAGRMSELIDTLLEFSRAGRVEMRTARVTLNRLTAEVIEELKGDARGRSVLWEVGQLGEIEGDPTMLRQVLANLLGNALKYTRPRDHARVEIGISDTSPDYKTFFVRDNGVGFDMNYVDKLFGVFQRLHRADEFEGTGVGLASVRRIIERHGGRAWAEGRVNEGATFYFSLPKSQEASNRDGRSDDQGLGGNLASGARFGESTGGPNSGQPGRW